MAPDLRRETDAPAFDLLECDSVSREESERRYWIEVIDAEPSGSETHCRGLVGARGLDPFLASLER
jgi:hypothetical protein